MRKTDLRKLEMHLHYGASANQQCLLDAHNEIISTRDLIADMAEALKRMYTDGTDDEERHREWLLERAKEFL